MLFYVGVSDMDAYYDWGRRCLEVGLPRGYHGTYFPLQYQVFELCAWIVRRAGTEFFTVFKLPNLLCDVGSFVLLVLLLRRRNSNPAYALLYWLHPWFLLMFSLGYVDFQFTFFVLLSIWCLRRETLADYLLTGLALGLAVLMKPQAQILIVVTFFFTAFSLWKRKEARPLAMLVGPTLLFLAYEWYFIHSLPRPRYRAALVLPGAYLNITNMMPSLTAQMTNIWSPVAYLLKKPGQSMVAVSDQLHILPYVSAKYLAAVTVLTLTALHVLRSERNDRLSISDRLITVFTFASMAVPFLMTSAHENHLFLGTVLLVLFVARNRRSSVTIAVHVLLMVQFLNLYLLYGSPPQTVGALIVPLHTDRASVLYAIVAVSCFAVIAKELWSRSVRASLA